MNHAKQSFYPTIVSPLNFQKVTTGFKMDKAKDSSEAPKQIIADAIQRKEELLKAAHATASTHISELKEKNKKSLEQLKKSLEKENSAKEEQVKKSSAEAVAKIQKNGKAHLQELVDLLYNSVIAIEE